MEGRSQQHAQSPAERPHGELRFPDSYYDEQGRLVLKNLTLPELEQWCASIGVWATGQANLLPFAAVA